MCNYTCIHNNSYMKHLKSEKHLRQLTKKYIIIILEFIIIKKCADEYYNVFIQVLVNYP